MDKTTSCVVYWLRDERCICPWRHGYIGISTRHSIRLNRHRRDQRWPPNFETTILFTGSLLDCRKLEYALRPHFEIGWNENPGGGKTHGKKIAAALKGRPITWGDKIAKTLTGHVRTTVSRAKQSASVKGKPKSSDWRKKMSVSAKARYADPNERSRMSAAVKIGKRRAITKRGQFDFGF